jgi:XTP/dITP diphosphohydrolase
MIINYVTSNEEKVRRLRDALKRYNVEGIDVMHVSMELPEPREDDMGVIAEEKARYAFSNTGLPCLVQDS